MFLYNVVIRNYFQFGWLLQKLVVKWSITYLHRISIYVNWFRYEII